MALPDYVKIQPGTSLVFGDPAASNVTHNMGLNGVAASSGVMSASIDFGAQWDEEYTVIAAIKSASGTVPTAGLTADIFIPCTPDTAYWPGGTTGASGVWPADGAEDEWALQLGMPVLSVIATANASAMQVQAATIWRPAARYGTCVINNNWNVAFWDTPAASNNVSRIILTPRRLLVQDAA